VRHHTANCGLQNTEAGLKFTLAITHMLELEPPGKEKPKPKAPVSSVEYARCKMQGYQSTLVLLPKNQGGLLPTTKDTGN